MNRSSLLSFLLVAFAILPTVLPSGAVAQESETGSPWPLKLEGEKGAIIIYQPQLESYTGNQLEARAAVQVSTEDDKTPVFGAIWFQCRLDTDMDTRMATLEEVKVTAAKFPDAPQEKVDALSRYLERELPQWDLNLSIDRLIAGMEAIDQSKESTDQINTEPPRIYVATTPSVLVIIDGDPILADLGETGLKRVVNTPYFIVQEPTSHEYYLKGGAHWYRSDDLQQGWTVTTNLPAKVQSVADQIKEDEEKQKKEAAQEKQTADAQNNAADQFGRDSTEKGTTAEKDEAPEEGPPPAIIVSSSPAELIQIDGESSYVPIEGTQLLYLENTESDVIMDIQDQLYYVLLAGRWYSSKSLEEGPWTYVSNDHLPPDFPKIPANSDMADVRANVPGTQEAKEAVLETSIPQTAEVDRKEAKLTVEYDGDPKFEAVGDTKMKYAVNTDKSVLLIDGSYYCCDNAIWFQSDSAIGPWTVSDEVPGEVQSIPADSPVYNVKYVYIYDSTPEVVYVGYTPGYTGAYVYGGCVVYGTGYHYHPWYHHYYYPRPVTWGFGVHYNPYTGWGFTFGVSYGWLHVGVRWGGYPHGGWWGPAGYRYGYRHGYHRGYHHGYQHGARAGYRAGYRAGQASGSNNLYRRPGDKAVRTTTGTRRQNQPAVRPGGKPSTGARTRPTTGTSPSTAKHPSKEATRPAAKTPKPANGKTNNVYADPQGNVYRRNGDNWEKHGKNGWSKDSPSSPAKSARPPERSRQQPQQGHSQQLERDRAARQRGNERASGYQSSQRGQTRQGSANRSRSGGRRR